MPSIRRTISAAAAVLLSIGAAAQDFSAILASVEANNSTLSVLRAQRDADRLEARTGLTPADPELGFAYLWETAGDGGDNRINVDFTQSLDFPTVYYWKKRLADGQCSAADYEYAVGRKAILLEAENLCIDIVYHKALKEELDKCLESARQEEMFWQEKFDKGEAGILELNKARFALLSVSKNASSNDVELEATVNELTRLNGGIRIEPDARNFEPVLIPQDFDVWFGNAAETSAEMASVRKASEIAALGTTLARHEWLPKLSIGYASEKIGDSYLQGISTGISIPLWENHGRVRAAKARQAAAESRVKDECLQFRESLRQKHAKALKYAVLAAEYRSMIFNIGGPDMEREALESGEINIQEYLSAITLWNDSVREILELERDCRLLVAELESFAR